MEEIIAHKYCYNVCIDHQNRVFIMRATRYEVLPWTESNEYNSPIVEFEITDEALFKFFEQFDLSQLKEKQFSLEKPQPNKYRLTGGDALHACNALATKFIEMKQLDQERGTQFINNLQELAITSTIRQPGVIEKRLLADLQGLLSQLKPLTTPNSLIFRIDPDYNEYKSGFALSTYHRCPPNIKSMTLISAQHFGDYADDDYEYSYLRVTDDKDNITYLKIDNKEQLTKLRDIAELMATTEEPVIEIGPSENWRRIGIRGVYTRDTHALYANVHKNIVREINTYIRMKLQANEPQKPEEYRGIEEGMEAKKGEEMVGEGTKLSTLDSERFPIIRNPQVRIVELGCGHAKALYQAFIAAENLLGEGNVDYLGGDYSDHNIEAARKFWKEKLGHDFISDKIKIMNSLSKECLEELKKRPEGCKDLVICSGHITRLVLNTVFEAMKVMHNLYQANVSCVFASGCRESLYSKNMLEKLGFQGVINYTGEDEVDLIEIAPRYLAAQTLLDNYNNGLETKYLDLSMCPDPIKVLTELKDSPALNSVECLDLSYCELSRCDPKILSELLKNFTNLKEIIFVSHDIKEVTFVNQHKNDLVPEILREIANIQINTLLNTDEKLAVLPYDIFQMMNQTQLLNILKKDNPELQKVPEFFLRKDYFKPSVPLMAERAEVEFEEKKNEKNVASDFLTKTELTKLRLFQQVDSTSHPLSLQESDQKKETKRRSHQ